MWVVNFAESDTVGNGSGLRSGLPDGTEQATLQEVEKELEVVSNSVKSLKSENQKVRAVASMRMS